MHYNQWLLLIPAAAGSIGFFCAGWLWCWSRYVDRRIEEIYHRGYVQGVEHGREMERLHV